MHIPMFILPRRVGLVAAIFLTLPLKAQTGLGLTPMKLEFPAVGGKAYSGSLFLSNSSEKKVRVRTEILDFYVDENQTPQFMERAPREAAFSCRDWISVNPMEGDVEPRSQMAARYTMRVPDGVKDGSHHCAIGFMSVPPKEEIEGLGVRTLVRVVATFYPIVGKADIKGGISGLVLEAVPVGKKTQLRSVITLENPGWMLYRPQGKVDVVDAGGSVLETLDIVSFPVLPQRQQRFLLPLKKDLAVGRYTLRARVDLGPEVQEATAEVSVGSSPR